MTKPGPNRVVGPVITLILLAVGWLVATTRSQADPTPVKAPGKIVFNRDIRPLLADRCFSCHGPDPNKRQAGLRLDRPDSAMGPLPKHPNLRAFVPGDVDHSEAIKRVVTTDPSLVMPPATSHLKLAPEEKELLRRWVAEGGQFQEHWAFTKPVKPPVPAVAHGEWARNDIDRLVLANLEEQGLTPSKEADKPTLIRRASLDLTGLPPTTAEVDAFVADTSPGAYEKVVDRLLASPRYGEQMAVAWLDYARYADSHGFQSDPERHQWRWRDWVIKAYNDNMPFDQFAIEQLAGDLLPDATIEQKVATGFNRNNRFNDEGGIIEEEWRVEGVIDRTSTTAAVFLGLTMECCRCHDHKYDPVTQKEFYSFSAYFNNVNEKGADTKSAQDKGINAPPVLRVPTAEQQKRLDELTAAIRSHEDQLAALRSKVTERAAALEASGTVIVPGDLIAAADPAMLTAPTTEPTAYAEPAAAIKPGTVLAGSEKIKIDRHDPFTELVRANVKVGYGSVMAKMRPPDQDYRGFDLFVENDRLAMHVVNKWPDTAIKVRTAKPIPLNKPVWLAGTYDGSGKGTGVKLYVDGEPAATEIVNDTLKGSIESDIEATVAERAKGQSPVNGDVFDARIYTRALTPAEIAAVALRGPVTEALATPAGRRSAAQKSAIESYVVATDPEAAAIGDRITADKQAMAKIDAEVGDTMVMEELPKPRDTFVLIRGDYDKHGDKVQPGTPAVLPPMPKDAPPNRLGLARWVVSPENPLTARVQVNRMWERFFGVGIVKTSENLGVQTDWPSNPALLDYLAAEFIDLHWDMKAIQKQMVMSATYRQSSDVTPELLDRDPENRLLARGPRFRLSAEQVRDQALAVSGLLVEKVGGPSVRPYEPADLWAGNLYGNLSKYMLSTGDDLYRRSLYTFVKRTATPVNLTLFDQPSREYCVIRRSRTDTPLQALDLMNDPTYLECSRALAGRMMAAGRTPAERLAWGFKRAVGRPPTEPETQVLVDGFTRQSDEFAHDPESAAKLAYGPGEIKDVPPAEAAPYILSASVILNLDEVVTKP